MLHKDGRKILNVTKEKKNNAGEKNPQGHKVGKTDWYTKPNMENKKSEKEAI